MDCSECLYRWDGECANVLDENCLIHNMKFFRPRNKKQETRNKKQETRNKKQETRNKKQETSLADSDKLCQDRQASGCSNLLTSQRLQGIQYRKSTDERCNRICIDGSNNNPQVKEIANCLIARYDKGISKKRSEGTFVIEWQ